jgi:cation diffusion facilitator CzcD-associated flavoprotein CzcO
LLSHAPVVVIGGGASGLSAAAALRHRGIGSVVLEQDAAIGGTWTRRYDRLHLHTMREFSGLAHFPIPQRYPRYLSRAQFAEYLQEYAEHFELNVVTGAQVNRIHRHGPDWTIETAVNKARPTYTSRVVVIATGQYREPAVPAWPGRDLYCGRLLHSSGYANAAPYAGQRVLVVGAGNSGAEIATDLAEGGASGSAQVRASFVALSVRTPPPIVPRDPFGLPVQRTSLVLSLLPPAFADRAARTTAKLALGDLTRYGMPAAAFTPYHRRQVPLIDVGFVAALKRGAIAIRPALSGLTPDGCRFADGTTGVFDAIVAATGFTTGLRGLLDADGVLDEAGEPIGRSGEPTAAAGLYFVGFVHSLRGHLFEANRATRRLARRVERYLDS